ncbi:MAG TPA: hypothetical protein VGL15_14045 [Vicinamibacteria bacterium]|jgi:hypothetical protein
MEKTQTARCVNCRSDIAVPASYAHGDQVKCGTCDTRHKVVRDERSQLLRLVIADVGPLRDAVQANRALVNRLEADLASARHSFGIGVNGLGLGVLYVLAQVGLEDKPLSQTLALQAVGVALVTGMLLELTNHFLLAKRTKIARLTADLNDARTEGRQLQQKLREASRA